jgi:hypothetical protein
MERGVLSTAFSCHWSLSLSINYHSWTFFVWNAIKCISMICERSATLLILHRHARIIDGIGAIETCWGIDSSWWWVDYRILSYALMRRWWVRERANIERESRDRIRNEQKCCFQYLSRASLARSLRSHTAHILHILPLPFLSLSPLRSVVLSISLSRARSALSKLQRQWMNTTKK